MRACDEAGITFIGPPASAIDAMGSKTKARELMKDAGVPIVPGTTDPVETVEDAKKLIDDEIGYPVAIKAAGGGGGKGFRVAMEESELKDAFEGAAREGEKFFSDATVYLERYLPNPRHVEVQVLADKSGNTVHLFERDCSVQRRHQKLIEESPAPAVDPELREKIGKIGTDAAKAVGYFSAGTIEGLLSDDGEYFFLEMNTRVQVEHCVTEMVTGIDIVREQIKIAAGEDLAFAQEDIQLRGHAIECRINAETAATNFAPAPGQITHYVEPSGPGVRVDSGAREGYEVLPLYDPMIAKLIVWDVDREASTRRMIRALSRVRDRRPDHADQVPLHAHGHRPVARRRDLPRPGRGPGLAQGAGRAAARAGADDEAEKVERDYAVEVSGRKFDVKVIGEAFAGGAVAGHGQRRGAPPKRSERKKSAGGGPDQITSPLQGNMWKVVVSEGDEVEEGQLLCIIEAMKMENEINAHKAGTIAELPITEGEPIKTGDPIATITSPDAA